MAGRANAKSMSLFGRSSIKLTPPVLTFHSIAGQNDDDATAQVDARWRPWGAAVPSCGGRGEGARRGVHSAGGDGGAAGD